MKFSDANEVDQLCYQMKLADYPRAQNRARINDLFNGAPPYSAQDVQDNNIAVNVNYLEGTRIAHDARSQFYGAFLKPGTYFKATTDMGPVHKRATRSTIVTKEVNRIMKRSLPYFECFRSKFASDVLHGVGISAWDDADHWCPDPVGIEDVMIPASTLLSMKNLPFTAKYRSFTVPEIIKLTNHKRNPGWNMPLVKSLIEWVDQETMRLMGSNWPEVWSPEKMAERVKGDGGFYVGDQVPTIDCWDFYFWDDAGDHSGWKRRIILDAWSTPTSTGEPMTRKLGDPYDRGKGKFLFTSNDRIFADKLSSIVTFQFADLSSVAPFRYHSVRSLGFLLYAVCHLQNRLRCKFSESVFESLMMYFRVKNIDDVQQALKLDMINKGFIDESINFVKAEDRFQANAAMVELGLKENAGLIAQNSSSYTSNPQTQPDKREKTKFEVMAEVNTATSMVSAALLQAYAYQSYEYREIFRRFCNPKSKDVDVVRFRAACLKQGVPENMLTEEAWDIEPERVVGAGNKTLEMAIAQQLMQYRNLFDPEPQRDILRLATLAITDDPARAEALVPDQPVSVTDSVHDAQLSAAALMMGLPVAVKTGINHIEYVDAMMADLAIIVAKGKKTGMVSPDKLQGIQNIAQNISQHIQIIAQDPEEKQRVKQYGDQMKQIMNEVKAFAQRLQEHMQKQQGQNGNGVDPKDAAKVKATIMMADVKAKNSAQSNAQRTAQRQIQFEMEEKRKAQEHQRDMAMESHKAALDIAKERMKSLGDDTDA